MNKKCLFLFMFLFINIVFLYPAYAQSSSIFCFAFASNDVTEISLSKGGTQEIDIFTLDENGNFLPYQIYIMGGSMSGTSPGSTYDDGVNPIVQIPLNWDAYGLFTLKNNNGPYHFNFVGLTDQFGHARAQLTIPSGTDPGLAGLVLHHAFVVIDTPDEPKDPSQDPGGPAWFPVCASTAVSINIVP